MQNFVGKTKCIAGYMKVANRPFPSSLVPRLCVKASLSVKIVLHSDAGSSSTQLAISEFPCASEFKGSLSAFL